MVTNATHTTGTFTGTGGLTLFYQRWTPATPPLANVLIVHGFGEHSGRYEALAATLVAAGYGVHSYDTRGHGRSAGQRGHIDSWSQYRNDLLACHRKVTEADPQRPLFLYGHSLGALMVIDYLLEHPDTVSGAIISGAPIELAEVAKPWLVAFARACSRLLPRLTVPIPIKSTDLSHDPAVIAALDADPLINRKASARWGSETLDTIARVKNQGSRLQVPMLFLHGADDPINKASGVSRFAATVAGKAAEVKLYANTLHEPHNDLCRLDVLRDVLVWLQQQQAVFVGKKT